MASYLVTWTIDIEAENPVEAALEALRIQRDQESEATHFYVKNQKTKQVTEVDGINAREIGA